MSLTLTDDQARRVGALLSTVPRAPKKKTRTKPTCERCGDPLTRGQKRFCTRACFNPRPTPPSTPFEDEARAALGVYRDHLATAAGTGQGR